MKLIPTLLLIAALSTGCAMGITREGFFFAAGDSTIVTEETAVEGGSVSDSFVSLIKSLASLVPFASPQAPDVIINIPEVNTEE